MYAQIKSVKIAGGLSNYGVVYDEGNNMVSLNVRPYLGYYGFGTSSPAYFRFSASEITNNSIVTVNEEITKSEIDDIKERVDELAQKIIVQNSKNEDFETRLSTIENAGSDSLPDYVITAAESVIDKVMTAQNNRTFNFAAITDLHYGNSGYTDGIKHACQAIKYIDERIKLDAVAVLGDYTDGYPSTGIADAMADFKGINALLDGLRFEPNLRIMGNHDYYPENIPITRRLIQYYSDDVVWGSRIGGYFYKDFPENKIRIICPNTNENNIMDTSTNKPDSKLSMTVEQVQWLISTLDLSDDKTDAEEWSVLILSHQPLDYWSYGSTYRLGYILDAY